MKKNISSKQVLTFYWQAAKKYPALLAGALIAVPFTVFINNLIPPLIAAHVFSRLSKGDFIAHDVLGSFGTEIAAYVTVVVLGGVFGWRIVDLFVWRLEANVTKDIAQKSFNHLTSQTADFHANHFAGSLVSQTNKLIGGYVRVADTTFFQTLPMIYILLFVCIVLLPRVPLYAAILLVFALFYVCTAFLVTRSARKISAEHATSESKQTGVLADAITNIMAIKSFARGKHESNIYRLATEETRLNLLQLMRAVQLQQTYFGGVISLISAGALVMGIVAVVSFGANIATVFLMITYTLNVVRELFSFSNSALRNYNRAIGDATDMIAILARKPEIQDVPQPEQLAIKRGEIVFENVQFTHNGARQAIFNGLDLTIRPGEKVGLVGHSGSGKTTLSRLLMRFSDITSGTIRIDGQDIAAVTQDDLHGIIAYVPQEPMLFHRSIGENIGYGKLSASKQKIMQTAKMAHAHEFIRELPNGYDTLVGERGVKLSGGQRQRIAIARAMLKNAPILLLDEATSALDSESEALIQDALWKLMEGRTAIVIAHRLSTIQKMDRIIVMHEGKIVEEGSHKELIKAGGAYAELWNRQSGGFIED